MLIDFTVKNFLSIKTEQTLSLLASDSNPNGNNCKLTPIENGKYKLLSFVGLYGPNASGKSNLIKAILELIQLILFSHKFNIDEPIPSYKPFKFDPEYVNRNVSFEIEFIVDSIRYLYSVEFSKTKIEKEELYFWPKNKISKIFVRKGTAPIETGVYYKGEKKLIEKQLLPNTLFLSKAANSQNEMLQPIYRYFRDHYNLHVQMDSSSTPFHETTSRLYEEDGTFYKDLVVRILNAGDLNIKDIKIVKDENVNKKLQSVIMHNSEDAHPIPSSFKDMILNSLIYTVYLGHEIYSEGKKIDEIVYLNLERDESSGTLKMYDMAIEVIDSLKNGTTLLIDEFNSGLHSHLNKFIVNLFLDPNINRKGAQLIISTHDTCVLDLKSIRRDQVWFTDKDKYGATELYCLDEFDKDQVRSSSNFSKWYLDGRFKAIPLLDYSKFNLWDD